MSHARGSYGTLGWARRRLALGLGLAWFLPSASCAEAPPPAQAPNGREVLDHLNAVIQWYRRSQTGDQWVLQPSDVFFWNTQKALSTQVLQAAFESAAAEAPLVPEPAPAKPAASQRGAGVQRIDGQIAAVGDKLAQVQAQILAAQKPADAAASARLEALRAEEQLLGAERDSLAKLYEYLGGGEEGGGATLAGQIRALRRSVPEAFETPAAGAKPAEAQPAQVSGGLIARATELFSLVRSRHALDELIKQTADLQAASNRLAVPLRVSLRDALGQGQAAAGRLDGADAQVLASARAGLQGAAAKFSQVSAAVLPLRREAVQLESSADNLQEWRGSFTRQYDAIIRVLLGRAATVLASMALLGVVAEVWKRATFRYVKDARRRRQLLLVRRVVTGVLMGMVIVMGFISDFSSLATFAGFITAGLAVALQTVILSMAAYFFLIGRYGVRVGDRITVSGVTGEVIDIGLVRVYLIELAGAGTDLHPTGRVVVFANSALFQAAPLYKQIPGTDYGWHQVAVALAPDGDHALAQERLLAAVSRVYENYKSRLERQHEIAERLIDLHLGTPGPSAQMRFNDAGIDLVVRYPVEVRQAAEVDDAVSRAVLEAIRQDPELKRSVAGTPRIRLAA